MKAFAVAKAAHERGYGSGTEIVPVGERRRIAHSRGANPRQIFTEEDVVMNLHPWWKSVAVVWLIVAPCFAFAGDATQTAPSAKASPCSAPEFHQLDFWAGDWDVFDVDNPAKQVARVKVDRILDGCVLREDYQDTNGHKGQSFSIYDAGKSMASELGHESRTAAAAGWRPSGGDMVLNATEQRSTGRRSKFAECGRRWREVSARRRSVRSMEARPGRPGLTSCLGRTEPQPGLCQTIRKRLPLSTRSTRLP